MSGIKMYVIPTGVLTLDQSNLTFGMGLGKKVTVPVAVYLIRTANMNILFDTGCDPGVIEDPEKIWGKMAKVVAVEMKQEDHLVNRLKEIKLDPDEIDYVILSHLHMDHAGGVKLFRRAKIVVQQDEFRFAFHPDFFLKGAYVRTDFDHLDLNWKLIDGDEIICPGVTVVMTQGHTPGHQSLVVDLEKTGKVILPGDCVNMMANLERVAAPGVVWDFSLALKSMKRIKVLVESANATIFFAHDMEFWERIKKSPDFYE